MSMDSRFVKEKTNQSMPASTIIPVLSYPDVRTAAAWLCRAFGFAEHLRIGNHRIQLAVGDGAVVITQVPPDGQQSRQAGYSIMVRVRNADEHFALARRAGARIINEPASQPYGERQYTVEDLAGHTWTFSQTEADTSPASWGGELVRA